MFPILQVPRGAPDSQAESKYYEKVLALKKQQPQFSSLVGDTFVVLWTFRSLHHMRTQHQVSIVSYKECRNIVLFHIMHQRKCLVTERTVVDDCDKI